MKIRRITGFIVLSLFTAFFLAACGGGGGGGSAAVPDPTVTTAAASAINVDNAALNGTVNPNGLATTYWFEWGTGSTLATYDNTASQSAGSGVADVGATATITHLTLGTRYYYRLAASNSAGTSKGLIQHFDTASPMDPPTVLTIAADNVSVSGATIHGSVIPNALATTAYFQWGTDNTFAVPNVTPTQSVGSDNSSHVVDAFLSSASLSVGTTYYFRIVGTNSAGPSLGETAHFVYTLAPTVVTNQAQPVGTDNAQLNGTVNPNGLATTYHFAWGTDNASLDNSTTTVNAGSGTVAAAVSAAISPLSEVTKYYYRLVATNSEGTTEGAIRNFTTSSTPPPTANAGPDQTVYMLGPDGPTVVELDGTGSVPTAGTTITSYAWSGPSTVTLDNPASATPSFTAPNVDYQTSGDTKATLQFQLTVTDSLGHTGTDNVTVVVKWAFLDDFSSDSGATYTVDPNTWTGGGTGIFSTASGTASVTTGDNTGLLFQHNFGTGFTTDHGVFALNYAPTATFGSGGGIDIRFGEDFSSTYYRVSTIDQVVEKVHGTVVLESVPFNPTVSTGTDYFIKITFDTVTGMTVEAFGETATLSNTQPLTVSQFWISTSEQNVHYDNITLDVVY